MKARVLFFVLCFTLVAFIPVHPVCAQEFQAMNPDSAGCGELLYRSPQGLVPLPLVGTEVSIQVTGPLIRGSIRQEFTNPTNGTIEALYVFPMPEGAAVDAMELLIGERRIVSIVQEKAEARQTYEKAKAEGKKTALVESLRPNLFTTSVAGIEPGQTVIVQLQYLDQAQYTGGSFQLAFPLTFTPRYFPPALMEVDHEAGAPQSASTGSSGDVLISSTPFLAPGHPQVPRATISVTLDAGIPLDSVASASHSIIQEGKSPQLFIRPSGSSIAADRDFLLRWTPRQNAEPLVALFTETRGDSRYGLLMVVPVSPGHQRESDIPTETLFLIDVSGSMGGASIRQARKALGQAVDRLGPRDRFNLMAFHTDSRLWRQSFQLADAAHTQEAHSWIRGLEAEGGTEMHGAMLRAMTQFMNPAAAPAKISRRIILITDASIGNEDQLLRDTANKLGDVRLHVVGIGSSPNRFLVKRLASQGGGLSTFVNESESAGQGMDRFLATINRPQINSPQITWEGAQPEQSYPSRMPELYAGELLLWSGKFSVDGEIKGRLTANTANDLLDISLEPITSEKEQNVVAVRWARMKVADQMAQLYSEGDREKARREIVATGLEFGLVTQFTSRVAVEETVTTDGQYDPHRLANGLPHGSTMAGALPSGGTLGPLLRIAGWLSLITGLVLAVSQRRRSGATS